MRALEYGEVLEVGGGQASLSNVFAALGLCVAVATAPAWGAVGALVGLVAIGVRTLED